MKKNIFKTLVVGTALGGALGVLFAPKSGKETRKDIRRAYHDVSKDVAARAKEAGKMTRQTYDQIVDTAVSEYQRVKEMTDEQVDALKTRLKEEWDSQQEQSQSSQEDEEQTTQSSGRRTSRRRTKQHESSEE